MINQKRRPRHIRYFYNPDRHPAPTPEDLAQSRADRVLADILNMSGVARLMLWKSIARHYGDELRAEMRKRQQQFHKHPISTRQKQKS